MDEINRLVTPQGHRGPPPLPPSAVLNYASPETPRDADPTPVLTSVSIAAGLLGIFSALMLSCGIGGVVGLIVYWAFSEPNVDYQTDWLLTGILLSIGITCAMLAWLWFYSVPSAVKSPTRKLHSRKNAILTAR